MFESKNKIQNLTNLVICLLDKKKIVHNRFKPGLKPRNNHITTLSTNYTT